MGLPAVRAPAFKDGGLDLPDEGLAVLSSRGDDRVVEGGPVCVENRGGVTAGEGARSRSLEGKLWGWGG